MKLQYVRAFIVLLAGLITLIINMKIGIPVTMSLFRVLVVLIIFYIIGTLVVEILQKGLDVMDEQNSSEDNETESTEDVEDDKEETVAFAFDEDEMD